MPRWIHNRAEHILAKNPSMSKSEAFAIATQQSHAVGKSPRGYGTAQGRDTAKAKYPTPSDDRKTANPGNLDSPKMAAFVDELGKIADINQQRLHPTAPTVPTAKPPNPTFSVKQGFAVSQFSGHMSEGPFPQASMIPAWRQPTLKQAGPPGDSKLESTDDGVVPDGRAHLRKNANVASPAGQLAKSHTIGAPRLKAPGPSIAQQAKPRGFGTAMPGLTKQI